MIKRFALFCLLLLSLPTQAGFTLPNQNQAFAPVDQAFPFSFSQQGDRVTLRWDTLPGYYLYQSSLEISGDQAQFKPVTLPVGEQYHDEYFGDVIIYRQPISVDVHLTQASNISTLTVHYQGCAASGFCYPPESKQIPLSALDATQTATSSALTDSDKTDSDNATPRSQSVTAAENHAASKNAITEDTAPFEHSESGQLANQLAQQAWAPLLFLGFGILLAFTPCVFPMYPILAGIVLGPNKRSHGRTFVLAMSYIQGMALTYTLLGLVVAMAGVQFQAALQHPAILGGLSLLFVALALSMFGLFEIQLPSGLQTKLSELSQGQKQGQLGGVFLMGAISGLICSPCTTAPLSGALLYVAQTGDLMTGAITLYMLALGMGIPLLIVAMFGNHLLPRAGSWMNHIKTLFGFILLAVPLYLMERIVPQLLSIGLWLLLGLAFAAWLICLQRQLTHGLAKVALFAIALLVGIGTLSQSLVQYQSYQQSQKLSFIRIDNSAELQHQLTLAQQANQPVMLDFYADWCRACIEFEHKTFSQTKVQQALHGVRMLQIDATDNLPEHQALMKQLNVQGLPTILFWNDQGELLPAATITGFQGPERFVQHLQQFEIQSKMTN
ncbi:Thiol:disulfide interchange protein DsbD [Vibrio stylophorae]|uniref:Thiol:disulfide interchange protein DsbD n=1 Tax=Vibrio stylophorae TaxID=659351 RepID=A0ABM8ZQ31_9VIBR|nr:protein-disulfide reductase DsbD [Vibrio stylophorae]CAH0532402.1 Thiol:disulfide interchange protein DsbD [Vibrio stylophorae]